MLSTSAPIDASDLTGELSRLERELDRRRFLADPTAWARERLEDELWSKQREILLSVRDHRKTAVKSCHSAGKSFIASRAVCMWLDLWPVGEAFVVTSAPTGAQVRAILWREINKAHARGDLPGRTNQTEWFAVNKDGAEELIAFGRKPDEMDMTTFQGIHARRVLVVLDEACGITPLLWEAADTLIANDLSKMLVIGNPDDPKSEFANVSKPGSGYNVVTISAFDTPNFTGEPVPKSVSDQLIGHRYVEEKRKKWAPRWRWDEGRTRCLPPEDEELSKTANPLWFSKICGEFPLHSDAGGLIPISWVLAAQQRTLQPGDPNRLGVDVGAGGDTSCIAHNRGGHVRIIREDTNPNTMETCGNVIAALEKTGATQANVDTIGIGKGVVDRGQELQQPFIGVHVGEQAHDPKQFFNRRAELYWGLRTEFESGKIDLDPEDEDTAAELVELRYRRTSNGKVQIESKDEMRRRGVRSPNRAEAVMLSNADDASDNALEGKAVW